MVSRCFINIAITLTQILVAIITGVTGPWEKSYKNDVSETQATATTARRT